MHKRKEVTLGADAPEPKRADPCACTNVSCSGCKLLLPVWRKSTSPDNNLGKTEVGPSREKITHSSAIVLLERLGVDKDSIFVDIGCGHGLVCMAAAAHSKCRKSMGIDLANDLISWALRHMPRETEGALWYYLGDILTLWPTALDEATHYYCNNRDFPPAVLSNMAHRLYYNRMVWKRFASAKSLSDILGAMVATGVKEDTGVYRFWSQNVLYENANHHTSLAVTLCGSRQRIGIYIMIKF
jgi:hypothetical protein